MSSTPTLPESTPTHDSEVPSILPAGGEFATSHWRIHRFRDSVTITHIENAGKRGKRCLTISVGCHGRTDEQALDLFVGYLLQVIVDNPRPETLAAVAKDANLLSSALQTSIGEQRGVDVPTDIIKVDTDLVSAVFEPQEFRITVTAIIGGPKGGFRQDSHLYNADRRSAKIAHGWAKENAARIGTMTRSELYSALQDAGARVNTWG